MDADVFKSLLALDAYNRGYNAGIVLTGTKIGNATIVKDSEALKNNDGSRADIPAGFYAVSYSLTTGENIISYRGTDIISSWFWSDNPGGDFWNGWATGLGDPANKQAELALKFYQAVAGTGIDPRTANISLTGHSLGGGLAGFVGDLYGKKGTLFNNMAFEVSAQNAHSYSSGTVVNPALKSLIYGNNPAWALNSQNLKTIYTDGEILSINRVLQNTPKESLGLNSDVTLGATDKHSMSLLTIMLYADRSAVGASWLPAEKNVLSALYNHDVGLAAGASNIPSTSALYASHNYADVIRTAIAYSAIDEGTRVFGDTGIRALFNDATDLGKTLGFATSTTLKNSAQSISDMFVQFAGQLALGKVLQSASPTVTNGIVTLSPDNATLSIDLSQNLWANGKVAAGASGTIVGRDELIDSVFSQTNTTDVRTGMIWLWHDTKRDDNTIIKNNEITEVIDKITFATNNTAVSTTIPNRAVASNFVGIMVAGDGNDTITGSNDRDFIYGGGGNDTLNGGVGDDLLAGGANDDVLIDSKGKNFFAGGAGIDKTSIATLTASGLNVYSPPYVADQTNSLQLDAGGGNINEIVGVEKVELTPGSDKVYFSSAINTQATQVLFDGMGHAAAGDRDATAADVLNFKSYAGPVYLTNVLPMNTTAIPGQTSVPYAVDMYTKYAPIHNLGYTNPNGLHFTNFQNVIGSNFDDRLNLTHLSPAGDLTAAQRTQLKDAQSKGITLGDPVAVAAQIDANMNLARQLPQNQKVALIQSGDGNDMVVGTETAENYIYGGKGNDYLRGGGFTSVVNGEAGEDTVEGGGFKSQLYGGGSEKDFFILSNGAFAMDAGTEDYASWGSMPLSGGVSQWWNEAGFAYWTPFTSILASTPFGLSDFTSLALMRLDVMPMTTVRYALGDSGQLAIQFARGRGGQAVINNYDLDLNTGAATGHVTVFQQSMERSSIGDYTNYINLALQAAFGICITGTDPLVIDLNKNGLELTDTGRGVYFDFDNNGFAERTSWVKATDGILVRDLNANGKIDNQTEMFGNATTTGLAALKALDSNNDNKITSADTNFATLKVWQDLDKDGVTDSGELKTLAQVNITQISLAPETPSVAVTHGNTITAQSTVTFSDGSTTKMGDVRLGGNLADTKFLGNGTVSPAAAALPDMRGYGTITNLDVAMTNDATLLSKVNATTMLPLTTMWAQYETKAAEILYRWAKVDTVAPTAMGTTFDRQKLAFLEKYFGYQLAPRDASGNPTLASVDELVDSWKDVLDKSALRLAVQGPLKTLFPGITYTIDDDRFHATTATSLADAYKAVLTQLSATASTAQTQWNTVWGPLLHTLDDNMDRMDRIDVRSDYVVQSLIKASDGMTLPLTLNQLLVGLAINNAKIGTSAAETLSRGSATGTQIYYGNGGNDTLTGGTGQDVYVFGKNFSNTVINDSESVQNGDRIRFSFHNSTDVTMKSVGTDLVITVKATGNTITVKNQYEMPTVALDGHALSGQKGIEEIQFADGKVFALDDIAAVVGLGTNNNDTVAGTPQQDQIEGLKGDDLLQGGDDGDTYFFTRGDGNDTISDIMTAGPLNAPDALVLLNMSASDLRYTRDGASNDLKITFGWSGDSITIKDQFEYSPLGYKTKFALDERMDQILFSSGTSMSFLDVQKATLQTYLTSGNDTTYGFGTDDEFLATTGNDSLVGMDGGDVYHFGKGSGQDTVQDQSRYPETFISGLVGYSWGSDDTLIFDGDIKLSDLTFTRLGSSLDLKITIASTGDSMIVHNQFDGVKLDLFNLLGIAWFDRIEKFQFSDGTVLTWDAVVKMVTTGTAGNDALYGIILPDTLDGGTGNDTLTGADSGDTYIFGRGYGKDVIDEGQNNVTISDPDQLKFKSGIAVSDVVFSRSGLDLIATIKGTTDSITLKNQYDVFNSGPFGVQAVSRVENFVWSDGTTKIWSDIEKQILNESQTPGNDTVIGTYFDDTIIGGTGNDLLRGGDGLDTYIFNTGFGQDTLDDLFSNILAGNGDTVKFGPGLLASDLRIERILPAETVKLTFVGKPDSLTIVGQFESSPIAYHPQEIESFVFADGTTWTANDLRAKYILQNQTSGNDSILGFDRSDTIVGGLGNDNMDGAGSNDLFIINKTEGNDTVFGNVGDDTISFGTGITFDTLTYTRIPNSLNMKLGLAGGGSVTVNTLLDAYGLSLEYFKFADGTVKTTADIISAYLTKAATAGNDTITGFRSNDAITGGAGNDSLFGDIGDDTLTGGLGNDSMDAAGGNDVFIINQGEGNDTIFGSTDYDTVSFGGGITFSNITGSYITGTSDMKISLPGGGSVTIIDIAGWHGTGVEYFKFADGTQKTAADMIASLLAKTGTPGDDSIAGFSTNDSINGLAGNDTIFGDTGNDTIIGGLGNDSMDAAGGDDLFIINKNEGNDTVFGNTGNDTISFGAGITFDALTYTRIFGTLDLKLNLPGGSSVLVDTILDSYTLSLENFKFADGTTKTATEIIADYIKKAITTGNDSIEGFASNDFIDGKAGNDTIIGDIGNDTIIGGLGNDSMDAAGGDDLFTINKNEGNDTVFGNTGNDTISFGAGITFDALTYTRIFGTLDLKLNLPGGSSVLVDTILDSYTLSLETFKFADGTTKTVYEIIADYIKKASTAGNDTIIGFLSDDSITGGAGNDSLVGDNGNDTLQGGAGDDTLDGNGDSDTYLYDFGQGNDVIKDNIGSIFHAGTDQIIFGSNTDPTKIKLSISGSDLLIRYTGSTDVLTVKNFEDRYYGMEKYVFANGVVWDNNTIRSKMITITDGNDSIYGLVGDDTFDGALGNDTILGNNGNDSLIGNGGDDSLLGGEGMDTLVGGTGNDFLSAGNGNNTIIGGAGNDYMEAGSGNDLFIINQGDGIDTVWGYTGNDTISFGTGITFSTLTYSATADSLTIGLPSASSVQVKRIYDTGVETFKFSDGTTKTNTDMIAAYLSKAGTTGNDTIYGFNMNDSINGGAGNDWISAGYGNNTVVGGTGNDYMEAETGNDLFVINQGQGVDTVWGYTGNDTISFGTGITFSALTYSAAADGSLTIGLPSASSVQIKNIYSTGVETFTFTDGTIKTNTDMIAAYLSKAGTTGNDTIYGFDTNDSINGGAGNDWISAKYGNNTVTGGTGNDYMEAETGNDLFVINQGQGVDTVWGYTGNDTISFGTGITFSALTYSATGDGNLTIGLPSSSSVQVKRIYDTGVETFKFSDGTTKTNIDLIKTYISKASTSANNTIYGFGTNDSINALAGNDKIDAKEGADTITGGAGVDTLTGGTGADVFDYNALAESSKTASDIITDFNTAEDMLDLRGLGFTGIAAGAASGTKLGFTYDAATTDTIIVATSDFKIILDGNKALDASDFIFS